MLRRVEFLIAVDRLGVTSCCVDRDTDVWIATRTKRRSRTGRYQTIVSSVFAVSDQARIPPQQR